MATRLKRAYFIPGVDASSPPQPRGVSSPWGPAEPLLATGDGDSKKPALGLLHMHPSAAGWWLCYPRGWGKRGREVKPESPAFHLSSPNPALSGSKPGGPSPSSIPLCCASQPCTPPGLGEPVAAVDANKHSLLSNAEPPLGTAGAQKRGTALSRDSRGFGGVKLGGSVHRRPAGASLNKLLPCCSLAPKQLPRPLLAPGAMAEDTGDGEVTAKGKGGQQRRRGLALGCLTLLLLHVNHPSLPRKGHLHSCLLDEVQKWSLNTPRTLQRPCRDTQGHC